MQLVIYACLLPLAVWAPFALWRLLFVLRAQRIPATVVEMDWDSEDNDTPRPIVEYRHPSGELRKLHPYWHSTAYKRRKVGDAMAVLVAGERARLATFSELWAMQVIAVIVGIFVAVLFVWCLSWSH